MARESPLHDFGLVIAYLLPGFAALWGLSYLDAGVANWLALPESQSPSIAGFLYSTVASIAVGLTVSTVRWLLIDPLHHATGIRAPSWDFSGLGDRVSAFEVLLDIHYKYYQFYANMLVSLAWTYGCWRYAHPAGSLRAEASYGMLTVVFFLASRDTLKKYYQRTGQLLRTASSRGREPN